LEILGKKSAPGPRNPTAPDSKEAPPALGESEPRRDRDSMLVLWGGRFGVAPHSKSPSFATLKGGWMHTESLAIQPSVIVIVQCPLPTAGLFRGNEIKITKPLIR
jgi:hypothetical protein